MVLNMYNKSHFFCFVETSQTLEYTRLVLAAPEDMVIIKNIFYKLIVVFLKVGCKPYWIIFKAYNESGPKVGLEVCRFKSGIAIHLPFCLSSPHCRETVEEQWWYQTLQHLELARSIPTPTRSWQCSPCTPLPLKLVVKYISF